MYTIKIEILHLAIDSINYRLDFLSPRLFFIIFLISGYLCIMNVLVRPWQPGDEHYLVKFANNENVVRNLRDSFPHPYTEKDARVWIRMNKDLQPALNMAIEVDGKAVGAVGIMLKEDIYRKNAEIGYWLAQEYWGKGVASLAVKEMVKYAFENYDVMRIYASTFEENHASQRVLNKAGFKKEAVFRKSIIKNGKFHNEVVMSLLKEDYLLLRDQEEE